MFHLSDNHVAEFVAKHSKAVIATVGEDGQPSTSVIFYIPEKNDLLFVTKTGTKKYENLKANSRTSLTILDDKEPVTVSMSGSSTEIPDQQKRDSIMQDLFKLSYSELYDYAPIIKLHKGSFSVFRFTPTQAKLTDFTKNLNEVKENLKNY